MFGLIANVVSDKALRTGAKVHVISAHDCAHRAAVIGLSKSGRRVETVIPWKRLTNIRTGFIPDKIAIRTRLWWIDKKPAEELAVVLNQLWKDVRVFHPDGLTKRKDGITPLKSFQINGRSEREIEFMDVSPIDPIRDRMIEIKIAGFYYACEEIAKYRAEQAAKAAPEAV